MLPTYMLKCSPCIAIFLHLHLMKKSSAILSFSVIFAVLFAIAFQSVHEVAHVSHEIAESKCYHSYGDSKTEITHQHHHLEHCFSCDFAFSGYISSDVFSLQLTNADGLFSIILPPHSEIIISFSGSLFALRAPPVSIG